MLGIAGATRSSAADAPVAHGTVGSSHGAYKNRGIKAAREYRDDPPIERAIAHRTVGDRRKLSKAADGADDRRIVYHYFDTMFGGRCVRYENVSNPN